jgi:putative DNA primase/helicase
VTRITISTVKEAADTATTDIDVALVLNAIRTGGKKLRDQVTQIRNRFESELAIKGGDLKAARLAVEQLKKALPAVTWSGRFSYRASEHLVQHSGLFCADLDELGPELPRVREQLQKSPHLFALFLSPTGYGLKAVFRVPADGAKHAGSFRAVAQHVRELTGFQIDESGKDVSRLCFMTYDPELYHNPNATELEPLPEPEKPKARVSRSTGGNSKPSKAEVREMLAGIPKRPQYHDWIKLVAAVGDALPDEDAIEVLNEWSPEESRGEYAAKLRKRLKDVHVGTLIHLARQHGYSPVDQARAAQSEPENENNETATIARLAALPPIEYDRIRFNEADKLGVRVTTLDTEVERKRAKAAEGETLQGNAVDFLDVEPYETLVNGAQVLDEVAATFSRYLVLPTCAADVLALWVTLTHCAEAFEHVARLNCCSPDKQCGKTTTLDVTACFVARPLRAENITTAVLFRLVEKYKPTLLLDEVDTYLEKNEELRGCLNAGHKRGGKAYRCEGQDNTVRSFAVFAPAALAGIGALPGTLHDRSIVIKLARAKAGEIAARFDSRQVHYETELCRKLARWTADNFEKLKNCDPQLPETAFNRLADNWRPLFAIAQVLGNAWPQRVHAAFVALTATADLDAQGIGTLLLSDIADIFTAESTDKLPSSKLAESLAAIEGRPWAEWGKHRKPISTNQLANQLRRFGISPRGIRVGEETPRGYLLDDFREAFSRYLPDTPSTDCNTATMLGETPISEVQQAESVLHPEKELPQRECCTVAPCTEGGRGTGTK